MEQVKDLNNKRVLDISEDRKTAEIRRGDCVTRIRAKPDGTLTITHETDAPKAS